MTRMPKPPPDIDHNRPLFYCHRCDRYTENLLSHEMAGKCRPPDLQEDANAPAAAV